MVRTNHISYSLGPIFDAYGPNYVIIPGSIGIVVALICFSFSEGKISA